MKNKSQLNLQPSRLASKAQMALSNEIEITTAAIIAAIVTTAITVATRSATTLSIPNKAVIMINVVTANNDQTSHSKPTAVINRASAVKQAAIAPMTIQTSNVKNAPAVIAATAAAARKNHKISGAKKH